MALTKVTGQVINDTTGLVVGVTTVGGGLSATDGFFSGIVTAVGNASFSGNLTVGGVLTYEDVTNVDSVGLVTARNGIVVGSGITLSKDGDIFATGITTISENLKVGTGVTISPDGDAFFTGVVTATSYSGIDLGAVTGASGDFSIADKIVHTGDTDTAIRFPSADTITAETGGSERIRVDSDGHFGVGTNNPTSQVDIHCGSDNTGLQITSTDAGAFASYYDNTGASSIGHQGTDLVLSADPAGSVGSSKISFQVDSNTVRATIDSTGDLTVSDGDLVIGTAGHGIDFSAQSGAASGMTSELLDHYEEGTWTPEISFGNTTTGQSYSAQNGRYTRVGNRCFVTCYVYFSNKGSSTGTARVGGLPFTIANINNFYQHGSVWINNWTGGNTVPTGYGELGTTTFRLERQQTSNSTGVSGADNTNFNNNTDLMLSLHYQVE